MGALVFLLPHPDDEFAVAFQIRDACRARLEVHVIFLTDGGLGGQDTAIRERESSAVLRRLGVAEEAIHFAGRVEKLPDGQLHLHLHRALAAIEKIVSGLPQIQAIFAPAWEGGHQDHDSGHLLGAALGRRFNSAALWQFPLYRGIGRSGPWFRVLAPLARNGDVRVTTTTWRERGWHLRLCLAYRSQWRSWIGLWPLTFVHHLCDGRFAIQPIDIERAAFLSQDSPPLYERRGFLSADAFVAATADFRSQIESHPGREA